MLSRIASRIVPAATVSLTALSTLAGCGNSTSAPPLSPITLSAPAAPSSAAPRNVCHQHVPSTAITAKSVKTVLDVITHVGIGPHMSASMGLGFPTIPVPQPPFARADDGSQIPAADRQALVRSASGIWQGDQLEAPHLKVTGHYTNTTDTESTWVAYTPLKFLSGTFVIKGCGAPYNDGTSWTTIRGTYGTYEPPGREAYLVRCGGTAKDAMAAEAQKQGC